ncbi:MAG: hypothetical protein KBE04_06610 [Phycisphaerae bacterium]|nr:hypothetical protein [Phycisphaerae bacterium]
MKVVTCLLLGVAQQAIAAHVEVAERLLVDLRSEDLAAGPVTAWPNRGSLGGVFTAVGNPVVEAVGDWENVVRLDGASCLEGPVSPTGIAGAGTRSIEVWAYNIGESSEECMVSWSHRSGPDGTNMTFNYGWADFGAAGHWGDDADMAWEGFDNATVGGGGYPPLENWQYLVYTYDGATVRLYVNGELNNERTVGLNTHGENNIRIGCQNNKDNTPMVPSARAFSGALAQVRIHDGVLTAEQIRTNAQIRIQASGQASTPSPQNGDPEVLVRNLVLSWEPSEYPATHTVYFSEDVNAVRGGTAEVASGLRVASYDPGPLDYETTYYWRVDEVNDSPDKKVFRGSVWDFTTEPYSVPIPGQALSATASSASPDQGPERTIDRSGLDANDLHSSKIADMWQTAVGATGPVWIQYAFDKVVKLDRLQVWNYNQDLEYVVGFGLKEVTVEHSLDAVTWTVLGDFTLAQGPSAAGYRANTTVGFGGAAARYVRLAVKSSYGTGIAYGLSEVRFFQIPTYARDPEPVSGAAGVALDAALSWRPGREATRHEVYFGTDPNALVVSQTVTEHEIALGSLSPRYGRTYYWKVAEVNDAAAVQSWMSDLWSFTTVGYEGVDDFESYGNASPNRPFQTWLDGIGYSADEYFPVEYGGNGTGAAVGHDIWSGEHSQIMETGIVHGGAKSMPLYYDNAGQTYSQTDRTWTPAQDWSRFGVTTLVVFFYGRAGNTGQLYVKINGTKIPYPGSSADLATEAWTPWEIDLASHGVPLASISSLSLGIDGSGASGLIYLDDIRLK